MVDLPHLFSPATIASQGDALLSPSQRCSQIQIYCRVAWATLLYKLSFGKRVWPARLGHCVTSVLEPSYNG